MTADREALDLVPADLDEAIEAYRRAAIAEHLTGADRSASIWAQRAAVVTLQDAHDALLAAISRRVPGDLAGLLTDACALAATVAAADADDAITAIKVYADDAPGFDYGGGRALYLRDAAGQLRDRIVGALARANLAPPAPAEES